MKNLGLLLFFVCSSIVVGQKTERSQLIIPPKQLIQINYPLYQGFMVRVWNKSKFDLVVSARDQETDSTKKDIRVAKASSAQLEINQGMYLQFENKSLATLKIEYVLLKGSGGKKKTQKPLTLQRAFYLENNTAQKIPLYIPGVGDSNLQPFTRSGLNLENGQRIYLNLKEQKILILTITDTIPHGARFDVASLINKAINLE